MNSVILEKDYYSKNERLVERWAHRVSWVKKGALSVIDQALISGSNFVVSILLARWLVPEQYGAYALAFECFLLLYVVYTALILEPMCVFGPSVYRDQPQEYLSMLVRLHLGAAVSIVLIFIGSAWVVHELAQSRSLAWALAGVALGGPCILFFWLVRRAMYIRFAPQAAVAGSSLYCAAMLGGLFASYELRVVSPFVAFLLMAGGSLAAGTLMLIRLKSSGVALVRPLCLREVVRKHWIYGRWALLGSLAISVPGMIYYPLLSGLRGLAEAGSMKALLNFSSPVGQFFSALFLLFLPYAAQSHHEDGPTRIERLAWRFTLLFAGMAAAYWVAFLVFTRPIIRFAYGGRYLEVASLIPWLALGCVLQIAASVQATALRAIQSPALVFVAFGAAGLVAAVIGFPAVWAFGLRGAIFTSVLSSGTALLASSVLLRRACRRSCKAS
jgi:O-antigen/teichoic acid export membrane protein